MTQSACSPTPPIFTGEGERLGRFWSGTQPVAAQWKTMCGIYTGEKQIGKRLPIWKPQAAARARAQASRHCLRPTRLGHFGEYAVFCRGVSAAPWQPAAVSSEAAANRTSGQILPRCRICRLRPVSPWGKNLARMVACGLADYRPKLFRVGGVLAVGPCAPAPVPMRAQDYRYLHANSRRKTSHFF